MSNIRLKWTEIKVQGRFKTLESDGLFVICDAWFNYGYWRHDERAHSRIMLSKDELELVKKKYPKSLFRMAVRHAKKYNLDKKTGLRKPILIQYGDICEKV